MNDSPSEIELLRAELAELRKEVAVMQTRTTVATASIEVVKQDTDVSEGPEANRRGFLRLAGAAAVGATAAAVMSQSSPAAATTGQPVLIGVTNTATAVNDTTVLQCQSSTALDDQTMRVNNWSNTFITLPTDHRIALAATTSGVDSANGQRVGVYGRTSAPGSLGGTGVFGSSEGAENTFGANFSFGVVGTAGLDAGYGVFGYNPTGTSSVGVLGRADAGIGVIASSFTGVSLLVRDGGRLQQALRSTAGAPTTGSFTVGEQIRDSAGDAYICTASGAPGTWRKLVAQHPSFASSGGSINLLSKPIRILDSRGNGAPITNGSAKFSVNTPLTAQITGTDVGGLSVPAGATGILGNLTATQAAAGGYALVWAGAAGTPPATSNINFVPGADVANYFISALDSAGKLNVQASQPTHLIIDIFGFLF